MLNALQSKREGTSKHIREKSICIITETRGFGGTEVHTLGLMRALIARGYLIEFVANRHCRYDDLIFSNGWQDEVSIIHTNLEGITGNNRNIFAQYRFFRQWKEFLKDLCSEIVIFPKGDHACGSVGFLRACKRSFQRVFVIEHLEADPVSRKVSKHYLKLAPGVAIEWLRRTMNYATCSYVDLVIAVSKKVKERLTQDWRLSSLKIAVIENGVAWQEFSRDDQQGLAFRKLYSIPSNAFVFGMLARLSHEKGIDTALLAMKLLVERSLQKPVYLIIAGEGVEAENLKKLAEEFNLQGLVKFIGLVPNPARIISGFDAILFASKKEGLPLALLEGMSGGCIPIVTCTGGMPEVVNTREIGWVVPPGDASELCAAMKAVLELDDTALYRMRQNALRRVQDKFDIADCHRKILERCGL
jgi:glycosyltransferase involved in cell wall biosynthesis